MFFSIFLPNPFFLVTGDFIVETSSYVFPGEVLN